MKNWNRLLTSLMLFTLFLCFAACSSQQANQPNHNQVQNAQQQEDGDQLDSNSGITSEDPGIISDMESAGVELHEVIVPLEFEAGEEIDNPYYKRTYDDDGNPVYAVERARNGQPAYLPMGQTVVYTSESGPCYYERVIYNYKLNGELMSMVQYQLYVNDTVQEDAGKDEPVYSSKNLPSVGGPDAVPGNLPAITDDDLTAESLDMDSVSGGQ